MNDFGLYFSVGVDHITDLNGFDHILFLLALCLPYRPGNWRKVLILITAFTVGHSVTLALSVLNLVPFSADWIEFVIPITIAISAAYHLFKRNESLVKGFSFIYLLVLLFGLIHGLGFSSYLKSLLGRHESIFTKLLAFNLGLEAGQLLIVAIVLLLSFICLDVLKLDRRVYVILFSTLILAISLQMAFQRIPF